MNKYSKIYNRNSRKLDKIKNRAFFLNKPDVSSIYFDFLKYLNKNDDKF